MKFPETKEEAAALLKRLESLPPFKRIAILADLVFSKEKHNLELKKQGLLRMKEAYKNGS